MSANRFALVSEAMRLFAFRGSLDSARKVFDRELAAHGVGYALALVDSILHDWLFFLTGKAGNDLAMWMAEVDEMKESAAFLARNEEELDYVDAPSFLRKVAAEYYMVLHDEKNVYEELYRSDARRIIWNMGQHVTATEQKPATAGKIADFWWRYADGKKPGVVAFCGRLSDAYYKRTIESPSDHTSEWIKAAKAGLYYGVAVASDLAGLDAAAANVSLVRADGDGAAVPVTKPAGGAAFFKVVVSDRAR